MDTIYVVQGFEAGKKGALVPLAPVSFKTEAQARARAERMSETCVGVIAVAQSADVDIGEYGDPVVLVMYGEVPELV